LTRIDTSELARYALAAIPGPAVDEAMREALKRAPSDRVRIGLINSLGRRKDPKSTPAVAALLSHPNPEVMAASVAALASIADRTALGELSAARSKANAAAKGLLTEAYVVCADHLAARGETAAAVKVYQEVIASGEASTIRARALKSLAAADAKTATPVLIAEVRSNDPERQVVAIRLLTGMQGQDVTRALTAEFPKLSLVAQVHVLTALAFRGDAAAKPTVLAALKSNERAVRAAALAAVGRLGDASSVKVLAEVAASAEEPELSAARQSLYTLRGSGIDGAIISGMASTSGKVKSELILAIGERATASASDALIKAARETDPDIRREALRALRNVGGAAQTAPLLDMLLEASGAMERRDATQTLASVLRRAQPAPVAPVISAYNNTQAREAKVSLLEVLGQTSSTEALPVLRAALKDADPEIARAAILALSAWDNPEPLMDLLNLAQTAQRPSSAEAAPPPVPPSGADRQAAGAPGRAGRSGRGGGGRGLAPPTNNIQVLALRGVLRLMLLQSERTPADSGRLLAEVMRLATLVPEKRNVLSLLAYFPSKESLEVAQAATRDEMVANEARVALDQVTEALRAR
jgi:HEAT repeat protein